MFNTNDLNYIELFLASDIKLIRYQAKGVEHDPLRVHNLIHQAIESMLFKLSSFLTNHDIPSQYYTRQAPLAYQQPAYNPAMNYHLMASHA